MVSVIESDRTRRPWVEIWGDWLYCIDVPKRALVLPLGDMGSVYHVHCFNLGGLLLSPCVRWTGLLVIVLALRPLLLVFGIYLAGLLKDPQLRWV